MSTPQSAAVDSRWWYWIAAVPLYVLLALGLGTLGSIGLVVGVTVVPRVGGFALVAFVAMVLLLFVVPGLLLAFLFPLALYVDAEKIRDAEVDWNPNGELYGIVGLAGTVFTAFTLCVPVSLYYLYHRRKFVGEP